MNDYIETLRCLFEENSNAILAEKQKAYLRNQFKCYGITTVDRRKIQKPFLVREFLPKKENLKGIVEQLLSFPEREYHYFTQELVFKYVKQLKQEDISLLEYMVLQNSWWDTVDFIANKLIGTYFKMYPQEIIFYTDKWLASGNIWLQRSAILFQLKYKTDLDTILLSKIIASLEGSNEFFINKAIGWILREYSRTNPQWVVDFVAKTNLAPLSKKEALRLL